MSPLRRPGPATALWSAITLLVVILGTFVTRAPDPLPTTYDAADLALEHLRHWAIWMTTALTGALAGMAALLSAGKTGTTEMTDRQIRWAIWTVVMLSATLFCTAWVLSTLPSIALRIGALAGTLAAPAASTGFDIYELPMYRWMESGARLGVRIPLAVLLTVQHTLWALAIIGFAMTILSGMQGRRNRVDESPPPPSLQDG